MHRVVRVIAAATVAATAATFVLVSNASRAPGTAPDARSADVLPSSAQLKHTRGNRVASTASGAVTVEDVGDVDSFGRRLTWLGLTSSFITLSPSCGPSDPAPCQTLAASPAPTMFNFPDVARVKLPAKASRSLLCYWWSPMIHINWANTTSAPVVGRLAISPTLTVENPVLADPGLIDRTTGAPFGGRLQTAMTSSEMFAAPLTPGLAYTERSRDSAVCMAGFVSRRNLIDNYGLTPAQADEFFRKPTTVRLNIRGSAQHVRDASMILGLRIIGD